MSALSLERVEFAWPGAASTLVGVDLDVAAGDLVALVGPNGAGKSTVLAVAAGLVTPEDGRALLDGRPVAALSPRDRARRVALVPQGLARWPETTVGRFVAGGRYAHRGWSEALEDAGDPAVRRALALARVEELVDRRVDRLSGGQRQRTLVARALAQEAGVLLVDEPTSALDPEHQLAVLDVLADAAAGGAAVLFVTHELHLAVQYARRLVVLEAGRVVAEGTTPEVLEGDALARVYGERLVLAELRVAGRERRVPLPWKER